MADNLTFKLILDGKEFLATANLGEEAMRKLGKTVTGTATQSSGGFRDMAAAWAQITTGINQGIQLANQFASVVSKPIKAAAQFESYEMALTVMMGSAEKAKERLQELQQFAATTPFTLPQVVEAGNQLQAMGRYSLDTLRMLGDLASASQKPFEQVLGAYAKLVSGQKGIAIDMFRDLLITSDDWARATAAKFSKSGEIMTTAEQMADALPKIVAAKGFAGMMQEQAKTFNGMVSNLEDGIKKLEATVGEGLLPATKAGVSELTNVVNKLNTALSDTSESFKIFYTYMDEDKRNKMKEWADTFFEIDEFIGKYVPFLTPMKWRKWGKDALEGFSEGARKSWLESMDKLPAEEAVKKLSARIRAEGKKEDTASLLVKRLEDLRYSTEYMNNEGLKKVYENGLRAMQGLVALEESTDKISKTFEKTTEKVKNFNEEAFLLYKLQRERIAMWDEERSNMEKIIDPAIEGILDDQADTSAFDEITDKRVRAEIDANERIKQLSRETANFIADGFSSAIIQGLDTGKLSFKSFLISIRNMIIQSGIRQLFTALFSVGPGGSAGFLTGFGRLLGFARGGIIEKPEIILAGEEGPEIIAPVQDFSRLVSDIVGAVSGGSVSNFSRSLASTINNNSRMYTSSSSYSDNSALVRELQMLRMELKEKKMAAVFAGDFKDDQLFERHLIEGNRRTLRDGI